ncbi:uncharacterized protein LOC129315323 isoform X2 [Prosopis cineraria]|uniref:uncharacterized protein LOC129315323 isoform X2 n=1 Tax=Prosopis cineraria TaxID=364024 RepID=UPI00240EBA86|nr:uncharacterized protein LOC129315323 isoform X2 [Prosopis cineraria]
MEAKLSSDKSNERESNVKGDADTEKQKIIASQQNAVRSNKTNDVGGKDDGGKSEPSTGTNEGASNELVAQLSQRTGSGSTLLAIGGIDQGGESQPGTG